MISENCSIPGYEVIRREKCGDLIMTVGDNTLCANGKKIEYLLPNRLTTTAGKPMTILDFIEELHGKDYLGSGIVILNEVPLNFLMEHRGLRIEDWEANERGIRFHTLFLGTIYRDTKAKDHGSYVRYALWEPPRTWRQGMSPLNERLTEKHRVAIIRTY